MNEMVTGYVRQLSEARKRALGQYRACWCHGVAMGHAINIPVSTLLSYIGVKCSITRVISVEVIDINTNKFWSFLRKH